jgi:pyrroline-5-carboxylate reductase
MHCRKRKCNRRRQATLTTTIFSSLGELVFIEEKLMDAATVLGACGIAYVMRFMRAMMQGGIQIGFDSKTSLHIVTQVLKGAAVMLQNEHYPSGK